MLLHALFAGLFTGLSLIVAIGAQNAFVLKVGLQRNFVLSVVSICAVSDAVLIFAGVGGIGEVLKHAEPLLNILRWIGVVYLAYFGVSAFRRALKSEELSPSDRAIPQSRKTILASTMAFTWLNPHVYLDTVLFLGTVGSQYGTQRWFFAIGASLGSIIWFSFIGFGAKKASVFMSKPVTWKVLDLFIAVVMFLVAFSLATTKIHS